MDTDITQQERWQAALSGFDAVWTRVSGTEAPERKPPQGPPSPDGACRMRELSKQEEQAAAYDRALAALFRGWERGVLLRHAQSALRRSARLRAEAFLLDGRRCASGASCPRLCGTLSALRDSMLRDETAAEGYEREAKINDCAPVRELLECFAGERRQAAKEKRELIVRSF